MKVEPMVSTLTPAMKNAEPPSSPAHRRSARWIYQRNWANASNSPTRQATVGRGCWYVKGRRRLPLSRRISWTAAWTIAKLEQVSATGTPAPMVPAVSSRTSCPPSRS